MEIVHAPGVITMEDEPTEITKGKSDSSMAEGCRQLVAGNGDAFISAGNSGALVVGATLLVKRIKGIKFANAAGMIECSSRILCFRFHKNGAGDGGRTHTVSPPQDFESCTSANSITPAHTILI